MKMYAIVRKDLKMGKGKLCAQTGHGFIESYKIYLKKFPEYVKLWELTGSAKIVLKVENLEELLKLYEEIKKEIPCILIKDAGKTRIEPGTITCIAFGPVPNKISEKYIKNLKKV